MAYPAVRPLPKLPLLLRPETRTTSSDNYTFGQNMTEYNPAPSPSDHPLQSGSLTLKTPELTRQRSAPLHDRLRSRDPSRTLARPCPSPCAIVVCAGVQVARQDARHHGHGWKLVDHSAVSHSEHVSACIPTCIPLRLMSHSQPKHTPLHPHSGTASSSPSSPSPGCSTTRRRTASPTRASGGNLTTPCCPGRPLTLSPPPHLAQPHLAARFAL